MPRKIFLLTLFLLAPTFVYAETAVDAYQSAHDCYVSLLQDAAAQKYRENWENCIGQFREVVKRYSRHDKGEDAKYSLGRLYEELAANSKNQADWLKAVKEYESFARQYARSKMADDAYFRAACIHWEQLQNKDAAEKNLHRVIKFYKTGDKAGEASKYLEAVEAGIILKETAPKDEPPAAISAKPLKTFIVVIDPGHGGSDTGAIGPSGTKEKDLTLSLSKKIAAELKEQLKNVQVFLTRDSEATLTLDDRVKFANRRKADFFISVHANASTSKKAHGIQTYYLNNASDEAASRLAAQENKNSGRSVSDLEKIISTMIQTASTEESRELAKTIHKGVVSGLSAKYQGISDQKVRSALFYVLVGVQCPSILLETSYISNRKEEKRLGSKDYQINIARAVAKGLREHLKVRKNLATNI